MNSGEVMLELVLLSLMAFFMGIVSAMLGIGGGVFMVPALILWYGLDPATASGTSLRAHGCFWTYVA
jgi:hypothetical protein